MIFRKFDYKLQRQFWLYDLYLESFQNCRSVIRQRMLGTETFPTFPGSLPFFVLYVLSLSLSVSILSYSSGLTYPLSGIHISSAWPEGQMLRLERKQVALAVDLFAFICTDLCFFVMRETTFYFLFEIRLNFLIHDTRTASKSTALRWRCNIHVHTMDW